MGWCSLTKPVPFLSRRNGCPHERRGGRMVIVLNGYVYPRALCVHCNAEVEPVTYSVSRMDYVDLDCPMCGRHLMTLYRSGGDQSEGELNRALILARLPYQPPHERVRIFLRAADA